MGEKPQKLQRGYGGGILREFSAGGAVYKKVNGEVLWLITKNNPGELYPKEWWRLPKGRIDDIGDDEPGPMAKGEIKADEASLQKGALREVEEEGGIEAKIIEKVGTEKYFFKHSQRGNILKFVTFYLMEYVSDLPEGFGEETSEIIWLPFDEAVKKLSYSGEKHILKKAKDLLV